MDILLIKKAQAILSRAKGVPLGQSCVHAIYELRRVLNPTFVMLMAPSTKGLKKKDSTCGDVAFQVSSKGR